MKRRESNRFYDLTTRLAVVALMLALVSMTGCIAGAVYGVYYMTTEKVVAASIEVDAPAEQVFDAIVKIVKETPPAPEIIAEDKEKLFFEAKKVNDKGQEMWGAWQVSKVKRNRSHVLYSGWAEDWEMEDIKERMRTGFQKFCDDMGFKCKTLETEEERDKVSERSDGPHPV